MARVFIGVDPHKLSATIEVVDDRETVLATGRFATDKAGYTRDAPTRRVLPGSGVGGRGQQRRRPPAGAAAARRRGGGGGRAGEAVGPGADVRHRPQPQDRPARRARGRGGRGAHHGPAGAGLRRAARGPAAAGGPARRADPGPDPVREPSAPAARRTRSRTVQDEHQHRSGQADPRNGQAARPGWARPADGSPPNRSPSSWRSRRRSRPSPASSRQMVAATGSTLMELPGVGPVVAARTLADTGDVARFTDRNRFASWTGTAPIEASSGEIVRHRLSRAGNRRMNHMIHIAATTQLRHDTDGRAYYRRKLAAGKTKAEAMRCLKRRISDALYRRLRADAARTRRRGPGRAQRGGTSLQRGRLTPAHRHFGSATTRTRDPDATRRPRRHGRPRGQERCNPPLDNRGVPKWGNSMIPSLARPCDRKSALGAGMLAWRASRTSILRSLCGSPPGGSTRATSSQGGRRPTRPPQCAGGCRW